MSKYKKDKLYCMIPVYASAVFQCDKPDNWENMSKEDQKWYFLSKAGTKANVCNHCSNNGLECDFEQDQDYVDINELEIFEGLDL